MIYDNVLKAIGNTPIVRLNKVVQKNEANFFAKLEFMNPGGSIKDRIGIWMIEDAEKKGLLKPGGTIVEGTSGNTGVGLAMAAAIKGYQCIFVMPDKMSTEKIRALRAFGAKVVVTPTAVEPDDPRSYYQVSRQLARETPNSIYMNQYDNLANREAHYCSTGPEILKQMPEIDVFIAGIGTGGTICGVGKYLKEHKPSCKVVAVDPVGSIVYEYFKTGNLKTAPKTYKIEGIGEDFIPKNYDFSVIDDMIQVEDKESFLMTRNLLTQEGLYSGISSGSAVVGAMKWIKNQGSGTYQNKNVLIILPDSGNRYLSKVFNDEWMKEVGFLEEPSQATISNLLESRKTEHHRIICAQEKDQVSQVMAHMTQHRLDQIPVANSDQQIRGIITKDSLLHALKQGITHPHESIQTLIDSSIEWIDHNDTIEKALQWIAQGKTLLVAADESKRNILAILNQSDLLNFLRSKT